MDTVGPVVETEMVKLNDTQPEAAEDANNVSCVLLCTVVLSPTFVSDDYTPPRVGHALLPRPTASLVTELLQLPVPGYGTVYRHISEILIYHTVGSGGH